MNGTRCNTLGLTGLRAVLVLGLVSGGLLFHSFLPADPGTAGGVPLAGSIHVKVVEPGTDDGTGNPLPVPGAFVMVGLEEGDPFTGNYGFADASGEITFSHPSLTGPQTVTAGADGYQYFTFVNVDRSEIEVPLPVKDLVFNRSKVSGGVSGFSGTNCDNLLQMVLLSKPLTIESLMGLSPSGQATEKEPATILGSTMYLDSNILIPYQKEWPDSPLMCLFLGLTVQKTSYSLYLPTGTTQNISAVGLELPLTGTFEFGQINTLKLGLERNFSISGDRTLNPALTHSVAKNLTLNVSNTPAGTNLLLMSLGEINGDPGLAPGAGELLTLGFGQMAGGSPGSRSVNTIARTSPFQDLRYLALASASYPEGASQTGDTTVLDRGDYLPPATRNLSSFLLPVQLDPVTGNLFSFSNTYNPGISPQPDVNFTTLALVTTVPDTSPGAGSGDTVDISETLWRLVSPGEDLAFYLPLLPPEAPEVLPDPAQTPENDRLVWRQNVFVLGMDPAFDFNNFGPSQIAESITHYSVSEREFSLVVGCLVDADCDDGNACNGTETCLAGICQPGTPLVCEDGNVCTDNTCDPAVGCVTVNNTAPCDDGNACTTGDTCSGGVCVGGPPLVCDDGVFCNGEEWCDPAFGCRPGTPPDCDDGIPCTENFCDEAADACAFTDHCTDIYVSPSCPGNAQPGDLIQVQVTITDGGGVDLLGFDLSHDPNVLQFVTAQTAGYLLDGWQNVGCTDTGGVVSCYASSATPLPESSAGCLFALSFSVLPGTTGALTPVSVTDLRDDLALMSTTPCSIYIGLCNVDADCDDGDVCNGMETCVAGVCQPGTPLLCDDGNVCTDNTCDPVAGCVTVNNTAPCDDGNACTTGDTCSGGVCVSGPPLACDDGNVCTDNTCDPAVGCVTVNNTAPCDDGNACTTGDTCSGGVCVSGPPLVCDDGVFCSGVEWCDPDFGCRPGSPPDCDDGIPCTENFCDEVTDACAFTDYCSDTYVSPSCPGNTQPGALLEVQVTITDGGGVSLLGFDLSYDPGVLHLESARTTDHLLDGWVNVGCSHLEGVVSCFASSPTPLPQSSTGVLFGLNFSVRPGTNGTLTPVSVTDLRDDLALMSTTPCSIFIGDCTVDADCDDGNVCNGSETCVAGVCQPGTPLVCDDGNACTHNTCHPTTGCVFTCKAFNWEDPCCQDPACAGVPICQEPPPGCFIATASFGTEMSGKIDVLRQFRDQVLLGGRAGTALVTAYYRWSPPIAEFIEERPALRTLVRVLLLPVVGSAHLLQ